MRNSWVICSTSVLSFRREGGTVEAYRSERKTAAKRGSVQSQAVRVNVRYDRVAEPNIMIGPAAESHSRPGRACMSTD